MHSWNPARASGQPADLDPRCAAELHRGTVAMEPLLRDSGQVGEQQPVPADADAVEELVASIGRTPGWQSSGGAR